MLLRLDRPEAAELQYRQALAWCERERCPIEAGRCLQGLAEIAAGRGDVAVAHEQLGRAAALFEQHGATLYLRQALAVKAALPAPAAESAPRPPILGDLAKGPRSSANGGADSDAPVANESGVAQATQDTAATDVAGSGAPRIGGQGAASPASAPHIFISYTSANRPQAVALAETLEREGLSTWLDRRSIAGGASWDEEIVRGIRNCALLAVLISPEALRSPHVQQELRLALEFSKPLLPLLLQPTEYPDEVKYALAGRQWVELLDRPDAEWLPEVLAAVRRLIARPGG